MVLKRAQQLWFSILASHFTGYPGPLVMQGSALLRSSIGGRVEASAGQSSDRGGEVNIHALLSVAC